MLFNSVKVFKKYVSNTYIVYSLSVYVNLFLFILMHFVINALNDLPDYVK